MIKERSEGKGCVDERTYQRRSKKWAKPGKRGRRRILWKEEKKNTRGTCRGDERENSFDRKRRVNKVKRTNRNEAQM